MSYSTRLLLGLTLLLPLITVPASAQKSPQPSDYERFITAISTGKIEAIQAEIDKGSDINAREKILGSRVIYNKVYGETPLMHAAARGSATPIVELLLDNGAQVNAHDDSGVTALMEAAKFNWSWNVKLLINRGAQVNARSNYGLTPLTIAALPRYDHPVRELAIVKLLLEGGAEVDGRDSNGRTPLALSAGHSYKPDIVALLLDHGAEVNAPDRNGVTPLMLAVHERGFPEIVKLLIEKGAQVDARSNNGSTPLHRAAQASISNRYLSPHIFLACSSFHPDKDRDIEEVRKRPLEMIQLLLENGAQVDARDENGNTSLIVAAKGTDRPEIIQLLIEKGAEVKARNNDGSTALMVAARGAGSGGNILGETGALLGGDIIELLLDKGANPQAKDASGMKAIDHARHNKALKDTHALNKLAELSGE